MGHLADRALTALLILIALLALALFLVPCIGYHVDTVLSGSMEPAIGTGDLILVGPIATEDIRIGDVIAFIADKGLVCHRVAAVESNPLRFRTRGDANEDPDPEPVTASQVEGKVLFSLPVLGYLAGFARSTAGVILLIVVPLVLIVGIELIRRWGDEDDEEDEDGAGGAE
jgi:signal peptidase I